MQAAPPTPWAACSRVEVDCVPIRLVYADGSTFDLPANFALDDETLSTRRAAFTPPGRVGSLPVDRRLAEPRRLRLTGTFEGVTREDAEALATLYRGALVDRGPITLYRRAGGDRYITVRCVRVRDDPHRGRFGGRVWTIEFDLVADDPFWYAASPSVVTRSVSAGYDRWTVTNPGGVPYQQAKITFTARSNGVVNPSLHTSQGGYVAQYLGTLNAGESVVLDGVARTAVKTPGNVNVLGAVNAAWRADGFPLQPGDNILTYQDDTGSSHACDVIVEWSPAWW